MEKQQHIGVWVTRDKHIRYEFLPDGRYHESHGDLQVAYTGYYSILGNHVEYLDDTGFVADGDFSDGAFYHAGMVFYREDNENGNPTVITTTENKKLAY